MSQEAAAAPSFEESLSCLEAIVARLERGDLPLEQAIAAYEEGRRLAETCSRRLGEVEQRIEILAKGADGKAEWREFKP
jgi:exodeoxyribonuclease VII small subunit